MHHILHGWFSWQTQCCWHVRCLGLLALAALCFHPATATAQEGGELDPPKLEQVATADELATPYDRYVTTDSFGREITFYLSIPPRPQAQDEASPAKLPLVLVVGGSGCQSAFMKRGELVTSGLQGLVRAEAKARARVMIVEKPGVEFLFMPERPGSAVEGSDEFLREHTLERWGEANAAAIRAVWTLPDIDVERTLCLGHSEGAIVVAKVAAILPEVTHAAVLSGGGATQLFSLAQLALERREGDQPGDAVKRREAVYAGWEQVLADPDSITQFWLGHPHRRWSSFLRSSVSRELLDSNAKVFAAQGTADTSEHVDGHDLLVAELRAHGRDVTEVRIEGADHSFRPAGAEPGPPQELRNLFGEILDWFFAE